LTDVETIILMTLLQADGSASYRDIVGAFPRISEPWYAINKLRSAGAISHPRYGIWEITEKGRIAAALARAKDPAICRAWPMPQAD